MKYSCSECQYVYEESIWDEIDDIKPGTKIETFSSCPHCWAEDSFFQVEEEVVMVDESSHEKIMRDHKIDIVHDNQKFEITIADNSYPMDENCRISSVALFDEYGYLVEEKILSIDDDSVVEFDDYDLEEGEVRIRSTKYWLFWRKFDISGD